MKDLEVLLKLSVLHCVYQLIASADGEIVEERDREAIDLAIAELGLTPYSWDSALRLQPQDCFLHIGGLSDEDKQQFRQLLLSIADMGGNQSFRIICANHLLQLCMIQ